jgi:NTP pyrophosphatase (non-canonical NTP hydrolase)
MQFEAIMQAIDKFVQSKGWMDAASKKPQTLRNLASSISIEAAELLECFQWSDQASRDEVENELADVLIYSLRLAQVAGIDPLQAISKKLASNQMRQWPASNKESIP